jgi:hypothetical protein
MKMAILAECPQCHQEQSIRNKACSCGNDLDKTKRAQKVRYWIDYIVQGTGKAKREPVAGVNDPALDGGAIPIFGCKASAPVFMV